ncbi:hypothetical protein Taro_008160 [Colocasia esculenta]|uniref:Uncharacterized protein n=1 Tax=Colocasia esculenta TaxID=4460 RepID=A0A843U133_COLES|nr:hypothetical protein [Colocasia esculenta]
MANPEIATWLYKEGDKVSFYDSIKAYLTPWYILSSAWLVLHHWTVRNTVVTTTTSQASPELLPAFFSLVPWFITEFAVFRQLPTFHLSSLISNNIPSDIRPLVVVVDVVVTKGWSNIRCSPPDEDRLGVVLAPHAIHLGHGVFYQLSSLDHFSFSASSGSGDPEKRGGFKLLKFRCRSPAPFLAAPT